MSFINRCQKIICENKKTKEASGEAKNIICDEENAPTEPAENTTEIDVKETETETDKPAAVELDEVELEFLNKFIELTELSCLIKANKAIKKSFKTLIGNNKKSIDELLEKRLSEQKNKADELKKELTSIRNNIKEEEKAKADAAERKLSLLSLLDDAVEETTEK